MSKPKPSPQPAMHRPSALVVLFHPRGGGPGLATFGMGRDRHRWYPRATRMTLRRKGSR